MKYEEFKLPACYEEITQEFLLCMFNYNPETGELRHKLPRKGTKVGNLAGRIVKGYRQVLVNYREYAAHRLIWLMMTGEHVPCEIDHINKIRDDNKWSNLRLATRTENLGNITVHKRNISGFKGVSWHSKDKKWFARITINKITKHLGNYDTPEEAFEAYKKAASETFGQFACSEKYSKAYPLGT